MEFIIDDIEPLSHYAYLSHNKYRKFITKKGREYKNKMEEILNKYMESEVIIKNNCKVDIVFYINKGCKDLDNMAKPILDFMNKIVYEDDRLVVDLRLRKYINTSQSGSSKIIIYVEELT